MIEIDVPLQPLRFPAGWVVKGNKFHDLEPKGEIKVKGFVNDDGWALFESELLFVKHEKQQIILDMGWSPQYDPAGKFVLDLVKGNYLQSDPVTIHETSDKAEMVEAVNATMLRISRKGGDYAVEGEGLVLQELCITGGWRVTRNQFFDLVPQPELKVRGLPNEDGWALFGPHMLQLETYLDRAYKIDLSWEPAHDQTGRYIVRLVQQENWAQPVKQYETQNKEEAGRIVTRSMSNSAWK